MAINQMMKILKNNDCYKAGVPMVPKGLMIHSTGANNPNIYRYVDLPGGSKNHWNVSGLTKCVHGFIGKFPNGTIGYCQTLPYNMRGWHAGNSVGNSKYIGVEMCEDNLENIEYFYAVIQVAQKLFAQLCIDFKIDLFEKNTIICHQEGFQLGIASNHADILHWTKKHGYDMDKFRQGVRAEYNTLMFKKEENKVGDNLVSEWAKQDWEWCMKMGLIDGTRPRASITRQEVAIILRRMYDLMHVQ